MSRIGSLLSSVLLVTAAGCVATVDGGHGSTRHPHGGPPGQMKKTVIVDAGHTCFDSCDHYCIDGIWYVETGHRHGAGCGHFLVKGKWGKDKDDDPPGKGHGPKDKDKDKKGKY